MLPITPRIYIQRDRIELSLPAYQTGFLAIGRTLCIEASRIELPLTAYKAIVLTVELHLTR